jgi:hypothetical protein
MGVFHLMADSQYPKRCVLMKNRLWTMSNKFVILTSHHRHKPSQVVFVIKKNTFSVSTIVLTVRYLCCASRKCTCTRRRCRRSSTPSRVRRLTTSYCGPLRRPLTVTSARGCFGESRVRVFAARSVASSVMKSARTS